MKDAHSTTTQESSFSDGTSCRKILLKDFENENFLIENILSHPIIESCLSDKCGDGNLWNGGLGVGVYLRIKLSEMTSESSESYLKSALEILWTCLQKEGDPSNEHSRPNESSHLSLLSNPFLGSRCLLVSLLMRLDQRDEAYEVASSVLHKLADLYQKDNRKECDRDCSILFGLAGALQVIWFLRNELDDSTFGRDLALTLSSTILLEGLQHAEKDGNCINSEKTTLQWKWNGWPYLGTGTGSVGILFALLGHAKDEWEDLGNCLPNAKLVIKSTIDDLENRRYEAPLDSNSCSSRGNFKDSLIEFEPDESLSICDWTHGAPGYCLLLLKAFDVYGDERFFFHARDLADSVIWKRWQHCNDNDTSRCKKEALGLAKGVSGIAYVFLAMARVDWRDRKMWIHRARELTILATSQGNSISDGIPHSKSLYDGIGGLASLLIDVEMAAAASNDAYFPFFESCQANSNPRKLKYNTRPEDHFFREKNNLSTKQEQKQKFSENITKPSPATTRAGKSSAETEITHALTESMSTPIPAMNRCNKDVKIAVALDVSQLTEPSMAEATPQRCSTNASSPISPPVLESNDIEPNKCTQNSSPKRVFLYQRPSKNTNTDSYKARSQTSMLRRTYADKCYARRHTFQIENTGEDDDSPFMTDSVQRIQRAEASWIRHFGTQCQKEKQSFDSPFKSTTNSSTNSSFRRAMGGFSGASN